MSPAVIEYVLAQMIEALTVGLSEVRMPVQVVLILKEKASGSDDWRRLREAPETDSFDSPTQADPSGRTT